MQPPREKPKLFAQPGLGNPLGVAIAAVDQETIAMVAEAVRGKRLRLAYQPIVLSRDPGRIAYWEGLIRVEEPNGRIIPASDFIDAVESSELGRDIDCAALEQGLTTLARHPDLRISVNMSARSIGYARWMATLKRHLDKTPTLGERLILEITEDSLLLVPELVLNFMDEVGRKGVAFALDEFGAGFSVIRYFKDFLFDILKIDRQFVSNIHRDPDNQALVRALASIGKHFEMLIVAEGVERSEDADFLQRVGVDCQQGYLYAAPTVRPPWVRANGVKAG
jgi:EAL domain-containing protein (putative c-di-GMP-specific phosphodiesterase class I)